jgi:hypothetical protein
VTEIALGMAPVTRLAAVAVTGNQANAMATVTATHQATVKALVPVPLKLATGIALDTLDNQATETD